MSVPARKAMLVMLLMLALPVPATALSLPFLGKKDEAPAPAPPRPVVTEIVRDTAGAGRAFPGSIAAATEVRMAFQTLGRLIERPVDVGDRVSRGDLLARLDPDDLSGQVRAAEAAVSAAEVNLKTAQNAFDRVRALAQRNVASTAQLEQAEQALSAARSNVDQSRAQLESARDAETYAVMTAPMDGVISAVTATPGAIVAAGDPILTLSAEADLEATVDLPESQLTGIARGTRFLVWHDRDGDSTIPGTVDRIAPVADAATRTRRVYITLPDDSGLRLGSLIWARLAGSDQSRLTVPLAAVVRTDAGPFVWTVVRDGDAGTVARQPVTLGVATASRVEVKSGLASGAEVVIRGVNSLTEGQPVGRRIDP